MNTKVDDGDFVSQADVWELASVAGWNWALDELWKMGLKVVFRERGDRRRRYLGRAERQWSAPHEMRQL
jgi:hypothetical protein